MGETDMAKMGEAFKSFIQEVVKAGGLTPGSVVVLEYRHDEGCPRTTTGRGCKCDPDLVALVQPAAKGAA